MGIKSVKRAIEKWVGTSDLLLPGQGYDLALRRLCEEQKGEPESERETLAS